MLVQALFRLEMELLLTCLMGAPLGRGHMEEVVGNHLGDEHVLPPDKVT
jgi:hypothetical protein